MFSFNPALLSTEPGHRYRYDGVLVPYSVTGVLRRAGTYSGLQYMTDAHRDRGTAVHLAIQLMLQGEFDPNSEWATAFPDELQQAEAAIQCLADAGITVRPEMVEVPVYHPTYNVAGRVDFIGERGDELIIGDWKTGSVQAVTAIQEAVYASCLKRPRLARRAAITLKNGKPSVHEYPRTEYHRDLADFGTCLKILELRQRLGVREDR